MKRKALKLLLIAMLSAVSALAAKTPRSPAVHAICTGMFCRFDADCASCPGGQDAWACLNHRCVPF